MSNCQKKDNRKSPPRARHESKTAAIDNRAPLTTRSHAISGATQPPTSSDSPLKYHPREAGRPILNALKMASEERLTRLLQRLSGIKEEFQQLERGGKLTAEHQKHCGEELVASVKEWAKLEGWIHPQDTPICDARKLEIATLMRESGWTAEDAAAVVRRTGYLSPGRPATYRSITIQAAEMKLADPKRWNWMRLARALCNCGEAQHDRRCAENLRRQVLLLKRMLSRLKITIPAATEG